MLTHTEIIKYVLISVLLGKALSTNSIAQQKEVSAKEEVSSDIRLNQIGFYPLAPKIAVVLNAKEQVFTIENAHNNKVVFKGFLQQSARPALNGKKNFIADFSAFQKSGTYRLNIKGTGISSIFAIAENVHNEVAKASIKAYYYQRASMALPAKFAGNWSRAAGHPDNKILIHPSAASIGRQAGSVISAPGGWYDAGDYNKYIVNCGVTMGTMLSLYEDFPHYLKTINLNIPESNNKVPDLLDELIYNLRWMLAMQDPEDGGVYNKLTNAGFDGMVMPDAAKTPRYVVQKGTAATLDFAAVCAQAARIFKNYQVELPGLSDSCLSASVKAWKWALKNPNVSYNQNEMNRQYQPEISTGGYGDRNFTDEFIWAAAELYITSGQLEYYNAVKMFPDERMALPSWGNVKLLGYYSLLRNEKDLSGQALKDCALLKNRLLALADGLISGAEQQAYRTVMGQSSHDFGWGSNSNAGNQGIALIQAWKISGNKKYIDYALANLDYLLGRNATGYSYVTGYGHKSPMNPHHRPSAADNIDKPVPGLLVGGPNPGMQDSVKLASLVADEAYIDNLNSFATNEIAINWNAPLVYLSNALEAVQFQCKYSK